MAYGKFNTTDVQGIEIEVGQTLAVAFRTGNTSTIRLGIVLELRDDQYEYYNHKVRKAKMNWLTGRVKQSEIEIESVRCVVIK